MNFIKITEELKKMTEKELRVAWQRAEWDILWAEVALHTGKQSPGLAHLYAMRGHYKAEIYDRALIPVDLI